MAAYDPDATGTIKLDRLSVAKSSQAPDTEVDNTAITNITAQSPTFSSRSGERFESTQVTRVPTGEIPLPERQGGGTDRRTVVLALIVAGGFAVAGALAALFILFGPSSTAMLTVTTVPPGAQVTIDGVEVGRAPLQKRVKPGTHTIALSLDGYAPIKEVVAVPKEGLPFLQPLKALPSQPPTSGTIPHDGGPLSAAKATADALAARAEALIAAKDFDGARAKIKELIVAAPDDPRGDALMEKLSSSKAAALSKTPGRPGRETAGDRQKNRTDKRPTRQNIAPADRKDAAKAAYAEGERYARLRQFDRAKLQFKEAIQLDGTLYLPHRALARIYRREGNLKQTRYHLKRYLRLGGPDRDLKVRRWLEDNPR